MEFSMKSVFGSLVQISNLNASDTIKNIFDELSKTSPVTRENIHIHQGHISLINSILEPATSPCGNPVFRRTDGSTCILADDKSCVWHLDTTLAKKLIHEYCIPTLAIVSPLIGQVSSFANLSNCLCVLIDRVCQTLPKKDGVAIADNLLTHCAQSLDVLHQCRNDPILPIVVSKVEESVKLPVFLLADLCNKLIQYLITVSKEFVDGGQFEWKETVPLLSKNLTQLIAVESEKTVVKLCYILAKLIDLQPEKKNVILSRVWAIIQDNESDTEKAFAILCSLADYILPINSCETASNLDFSIVRYDSFWKLIQTGIAHKNTLSRKRSQYLLKRIVDIFEHGKGRLTTQDCNCPLFWWDAREERSLVTVWQDYMLLIEMLEESQMHVIRPLFPRLKLLEVATHERKAGRPHSQWSNVLLDIPVMGSQ
jgi:hypothetical protein